MRRACSILLVCVASATAYPTFSVTGGPADVIGSWFSEEWFGSNAADGSFTYQAKDGTGGSGYYLSHECATIDGFPGWHGVWISEFPQPGQNPGNGSTAVYCESGYVTNNTYVSFFNTSAATPCPLPSTSTPGVVYLAYPAVPGTASLSLGTALGTARCASQAVEGLTPSSAPVTASGTSDGAVKSPAQAPIEELEESMSD